MWGHSGWLHELFGVYRLLCGDSLTGYMNCVMSTDFYVGQPGWLHELCDVYRLLCGDGQAGYMNCVMSTDFYVGTARLAT